MYWTRAYSSNEKAMRDPSYYSWMKGQRCCACQAPPPSDPHHTESGKMGGKKSDLWLVPLCRHCHSILHTTTQRKFENEWRIKSLYRQAILHRIRYLKTNAHD